MNTLRQKKKNQPWNQVKRVIEGKQGKQNARNKSAKERVIALTLLQVQSPFNSPSLELPQLHELTLNCWCLAAGVDWQRISCFVSLWYGSNGKGTVVSVTSVLEGTVGTTKTSLACAHRIENTFILQHDAHTPLPCTRACHALQDVSCPCCSSSLRVVALGFWQHRQ